MVFYNETGTIGILLAKMTTYVAGTEPMTLLLLLVIFYTLMFALKVPIEISSVFTFPYVIAVMAYNTELLPIGGTILFFLAIFMAGKWLFGR